MRRLGKFFRCFFVFLTYSPAAPFFAVFFIGRFLSKVDKDGHVKRSPSTFRDTISTTNPVSKPGAYSRAPSQFRDRVSVDDPTFKPGEPAPAQASIQIRYCATDT